MTVVKEVVLAAVETVGMPYGSRCDMTYLRNSRANCRRQCVRLGLGRLAGHETCLEYRAILLGWGIGATGGGKSIMALIISMNIFEGYSFVELTPVPRANFEVNFLLAKIS
jgi:hypothetical protein